MKNRYFIGIDGGLQGAIAIMNREKQVMKLIPMPIINGKRKQYDIQEIKEVLASYAVFNTQVCIEKLQPTPKVSKVACGSMMYCLGIFEGICTTLGLSYQVIQARTWQKYILKGLSGTSKQKSIAYVKKKYPEINLKRTQRSTKDDDNFADAIGIAEFCASS